MGESEAARRFFKPSKGEHGRIHDGGRDDSDKNERLTCRPLRLRNPHLAWLAMGRPRVR